MCPSADPDAAARTKAPPEGVPGLERPLCEPVELAPGARIRIERVRNGPEAGASGSFPHFHDVHEVVLFGATFPLGLLGPRLRGRTGVPYVGFTHGLEVSTARMPGGPRLLRSIGDDAAAARVDDPGGVGQAVDQRGPGQQARRVVAARRRGARRRRHVGACRHAATVSSSRGALERADSKK